MGGSDVKWNNLITPFPIKRKKETKTKKQNGKNIKQKTKKRYHIREPNPGHPHGSPFMQSRWEEGYMT